MFASISSVFASQPIPNKSGIFIPNHGQWPAHIKYLAKTPSMNMWITNKGIVHDYFTVNRTNAIAEKKGHAYIMELQNGISTNGSGLEQSPTMVNYFKGNNPNAWITNVPSYTSVKLHQVYAGIDMVYSFEGNSPRYDFHVSPGTDPSKIVLSFDGAATSVDKDGTLNIATRFGTVKNGKIYAFQKDDAGIAHKIECSFVKTTKGLSFSLANYDKSRTLIIDPLVYSSYVGTTGANGINAMATDNSGNVIAAGYTETEDFPEVTGSYDTKYNGGVDGLVIRFSPQLEKTLSLSYLGGGGDDIINAIAIDFNGGIFLGGETSSINFPLSTSWKDALKSGIDGFVSKMSSSGSQLIYSGYLPGSGEDRVLTIAARPTGELLVGGVTNSSDFPTDNGAYQKLKKANFDGFALELRSGGSLINFSTFIGGDGDDRVTGVGYDPSFSNVFIAGTTGAGISGGAYPVPNMMNPTRRPWDDTYNLKDDGFVAKFGIAGTPADPNVHFLGYLGGNGNDRITGLTSLDDGTVVVCGETDFGTGATTKFPTTGTTTSGKGGFDIFVSRVSSNGRTLQNSGVFGTGGTESATAVDFVAGTSQILVAGWTSSRDFSNTQSGSAITENEYGGGPKDAVILKLSNDLTDLSFSSYYGGSGEDIGKAICETPRGDIFFAGTTTSPDLKMFVESNNTVAGQGTNGFVAKVAFGSISLSSPSAYSTYCAGGIIPFNWTKENLTPTELVNIQLSSDGGTTWNTVAKDLQGSSYGWKVPDDYVAGTIYRARVINVISGIRDVSDTTFKIAENTVITEQPVGDSLCPGSQFRITVHGNGKGTYEWRFNGTVIQGARDSVLTIPAVKSTDAGDYVATVNTGCKAAQSQPAKLYVKPNTKIATQPVGAQLTAGEPLQLKVSAVGLKLTYEWFVDGFKINNAVDSVYKIPSTNLGNSGDYKVVVHGECGSDTSAIAKVVVSPPSSISESIDENINGLLVKVYGDPMQEDNYFVTLTSANGGSCSIDIVSTMGSTLASMYKGTIAPNDNRQFPIPQGLASGSYWIVAKVGNAISSKQLLITR